jgi:hypothetical protein
MSTFDQIATKIIKEQELVIGPLAWQQASKVSGLHVVDQKSGQVTIDSSNAQTIVDNLVRQYSSLFGRAALEASKEAVGSILADLSPAEIPSSLR